MDFDRKLSEAGKKTDKECHLANKNVDRQESTTTFENLNKILDGEDRRKKQIKKHMSDVKTMKTIDEKINNEDEKTIEDDEKMKTQKTMKINTPMKENEERKNSFIEMMKNAKLSNKKKDEN